MWILFFHDVDIDFLGGKLLFYSWCDMKNLLLNLHTVKLRCLLQDVTHAQVKHGVGSEPDSADSPTVAPSSLPAQSLSLTMVINTSCTNLQLYSQ